MFQYGCKTLALPEPCMFEEIRKTTKEFFKPCIYGTYDAERTFEVRDTLDLHE